MNSTGAVEEEEEDDKLCREIYEHWAARKLERQEGCDKKKLELEKKKTGLDIRQKAVEGLKERNRGAFSIQNLTSLVILKIKTQFENVYALKNNIMEPINQ